MSVFAEICPGMWSPASQMYCGSWILVGDPWRGDHAADRVRDANSLNSDEDLKRGSSLNKHPRDYTSCLLD